MPERRDGTMRAVLAFTLLLLCGSAQAALDLSRAAVQRLDNGLEVIVLEEPALPLVSVQMVYRVGAKHEPAGSSGLAHFLEHMAFRSSENFPDSGLVSEIYAAGGEWHGYTWLDQTTYFATVPKDYLELLLRIEADRMGRLLIPEADVEAERGAVLAEMHGYENDPATVLQDYVMYLSFVAHPYRANTIGWESDIAGLTHDEVVDFYRRHYQPGNAVLAVVGDVDAARVFEQVAELFGEFPGAARRPPPRTREPPQRGERRIRLQGATDRKHFKIAWHAPSVHSPDFAAFLVLQELLAGGSGVSFLQNDWGTPARQGSPLAAVTADIATWYPPSEEDYVFTVSGSIGAEEDELELERGVAAAIARLQALEDEPETLALAQARVLRALRFDVQTTEDAAHQLAFFAGMDALDVLTGLPQAVERVRLEDVRRLAANRLQGAQRSIGWLVPAGEEAARPTKLPSPAAAAFAAGPRGTAGQGAMTSPSTQDGAGERIGAPGLRRLDSGTVAIAQRSPLSATVHLRTVLPGTPLIDGVEWQAHEPAWGFSTASNDLLPGELPGALTGLAAALAEAQDPAAQPAPVADDPLGRLHWHFREILGLSKPVGRPWPRIVVAGGDLEPEEALAAIEVSFGAAPGAAARPQSKSESEPESGTAAAPGRSVRMQVEYRLERPFAQEALGYVVPAPGPRAPDAAAWQLALYVLSHGYEGRLGKEAISRRGLVYYIDSAYDSDGRNGWITVATGVDPAKLPDMRRLLWTELQRLVQEPPSQDDLDEARRHLLGRRLSAAQSNPELTDRLARDWLWYGELPDHGELTEQLEQVSLEDLHRILPAFTAGTVVAVRNPAVDPAP